MRLMLLTFQKDARRLWPAAVVTWVMLGVLAHTDRWRADWIASPMEGWMNLLLTMAWASLLALAVLEEPLVGDNNFWTTRPHRWPPLLTAKLLFAVLAIHLPSFIADVYVLAARGFSPAEYFGALFWKQVLFFGAVTLPSIALASLVRGFTHFVIAVFVIAAALAILNGGFQGFPELGRQDSAVRHSAVRIVLASAALVVVWTQYAKRRATPARVLAIVAGLAAASISAWLPVRAEYAMRVRDAADRPRIALRSSPPADAALRSRVGGRQPAVMLPITVTPGPGGDRFHLWIIDLEIVTPDGTRIRTIRSSPNRPFEKIDLMAFPYSLSRDVTPEWLTLSFSGPAWERVRSAPVRVRGTAAIEFYRSGETVSFSTRDTGSVSNLGRCSTSTVDDRFSDGMLKVLCESPGELPAASVTLRNDNSGRVWRQHLNESASIYPGPHEAWLSPLRRGQTFFHLTDDTSSAPGSGWLVPRGDVASSRVEISPTIVTGHAVADFDFGDVALASWLLPR